MEVISKMCQSNLLKRGPEVVLVHVVEREEVQNKGRRTQIAEEVGEEVGGEEGGVDD